MKCSGSVETAHAAIEEMLGRGGCWTPNQYPHLVKPSPFRLPWLFKLYRAVSTVPDKQGGAGRAGGPAQASSTTQGGPRGQMEPNSKKTPLTLLFLLKYTVKYNFVAAHKMRLCMTKPT